MVPETVSEAIVFRRELMGGTLTASSVYRSVLDAGLAVDVSTHCWVLKEQTFFPGKKYDLLGSAVDTAVLCASAGLALGFGWVCCLRTAQWTRASLLVSVEERTVDALAPGADEGRRRLR